MYEHIRAVQEDNIGRITFNRPKAKNAFIPEMLAEVCDAVEAYEKNDSVRAIVFAGNGDAFSAGGDLTFLDSLRGLTAFEIRSAVYEYFGRAARTIKLCSKPTIAAVNGPAVGAGCEMALACDFRVANENAMFCEAWIGLGTIPPLGGMFLLPRIVGLGHATDMILRGTRVRARRALEIGLVNELAEGEAFDEAVTLLAKELAAAPPLAMAIAKEGLIRGMNSTLESEWSFNVYAQSMLLDSADHAEALKSRKERRAPSFAGK